MKRIFLLSLLLLLVLLVGCNSSEQATKMTTLLPVLTQPPVTTTAVSATLPENPSEDCEANLTELILAKKDNPAIAQDISLVIDEATLTATLNLSYQQYADLTTLSSAILRAQVKDGSADYTAKNPDGSLDLMSGAHCVVTDSKGDGKAYQLIVNRTIYKLPIVNITLSNGVGVDKIDRNQTTQMVFSMDCSGTVGFEMVDPIQGKIRGHGNSTWQWDKKPYKIKLDEKASLLGLEENRDWILLANYADKSLIRNTLAYEMGRVMDRFLWTPTQYPVDLFINGEYQGVYSLGEHMEVAQGRVDIEEGSDVDTDYFIEIGGMAATGDVVDEDYFHTDGRLVRFATFKSPDAESITNGQKAFITDYFQKAEDAIKAGKGYEEYIDVDSFVDWILIHELSYNVDSCFRRSCFLVKEKGGKLKMGPIWDFDLAFGNFSRDNENYDNLITPGEGGEDPYIPYNWCTYLLRDPEFCQQLYARWQEVRDVLLQTANETISHYSALLDGSQQENYQVWQTWDIRVGFQSKWCMKANSFEKQMRYLRDFLEKRASWMDQNLPRG